MKFGRRDSLFASPPPSDLPMDDDHMLPPPKAPALPRAAAPQTQTTELNAFLGRGCIYEGKLTFEGRVRIDGKFTGEIFSNDVLEIGPDAELDAEIDVSTVIIAGRVNGNVNARYRCDLRAPGVVIGNITSPIVTMDEGVRFDGEMRMTSFEEQVRAPTKRAPAPMVTKMEESIEEVPTAAAKKERRSAPASRDPSELLKPVP
jgi:cytoskeletal protein CcmA (bactofilin family)